MTSLGSRSQVLAKAVSSGWVVVMVMDRSSSSLFALHADGLHLAVELSVLNDADLPCHGPQPCQHNIATDLLQGASRAERVVWVCPVTALWCLCTAIKPAYVAKHPCRVDHQFS